VCPREAVAKTYLCYYLESKGSRVSSGSIVSDYGLNNRAIGVRSPAGANDFSSSICVQTGSGAHPASCTMGTGGPFPGGKARPGGDADHSPHLVPRSWMSRSYTSSMACNGTALLYLLLLPGIETQVSHMVSHSVGSASRNRSLRISC
jgi:hypothetical protein